MTLQEKLKFIIQNWGKMLPDELAEKLKVSKSSIAYYVSIIRKHGIVLPHLPHTGRPTEKINWEELKKYV